MSNKVTSSDTPSILSLPSEIIERICNSGPPGSALPLSRAIPHFTPHAEYNIWMANHFTPPPHFGEYPLIRSEGLDEDEWARGMATEGELRCRARLAERAKEMLHRGNERRWGYVRVLRIASRPVAVHPLAQILDFAAPTLCLLELHGPPKHVFQADWRPAMLDTLEYCIFMRHISFPYLTVLRVSLGALRYPAAIITLAQSAPRLGVLDVDLGSLHDCDPNDDPRGALSFRALKPSVQTLPSLIRMRYICSPLCEHSREQARILVHLLKSSEKLEQLVVGCEAAPEVETMLIFEALGNLANLHAIDWKAPMEAFMPLPGGFENLHRLLVPMTHWEDLFIRLPQLDRLQVLHFRGVPLGLAENTPTAIKRDRNAPSPYEIQKMVPEFARGLRRCPQLRAIHFTAYSVQDPGLLVFTLLDSFEARVPTLTIRSMRHGDDELLHARIFMPYRTVADFEHHGDTYADPDTVVVHYSRGGRAHLKLLARESTASWHDYTDSGGRAIPLAVVNMMAELEGLPVDWTGRGVEVGDEAWKVLEDWKEQLPPGSRFHGIVARRRGK